MFTGIIEATGIIIGIAGKGTNKTFRVQSSMAHELKPDQSLSHNGVCLTVEAIKGNEHIVTAILETLEVTNLEDWAPGTIVNLERCLQMNGRLDGHIVQGHVDATAVCETVKDKEGSWEYCFRIPGRFRHLVIEKGSICLNGISLTIFNLEEDKFTVGIIPYTFEHTNMQQVKPGDKVNIEFDVIGKYVQRMHFAGNTI
ncbi:MAG: riboflavin synthase [Ferruginibacter sp.]